MRTKRGTRDIGYHFVIQRNGEVDEGRPIEQTGAHVKGHNHDSIGICYIGGVEAATQIVTGKQNGSLCLSTLFLSAIF